MSRRRKERWFKQSLLFVLIYVIAGNCLSPQSQTQPSAPKQFRDCTDETKAFVEEQQAKIKLEIDALKGWKMPGYYEAGDEGGNHWFLLWAPKSGFLIYLMPDQPCPTQVSYGEVVYRRGKLTLKPQIPFAPKMKFIFDREYRIILYRKQRYLVPIPQIREFYRTRSSRVPELETPFLSQREFAEPYWRKYR